MGKRGKVVLSVIAVISVLVITALVFLLQDRDENSIPAPAILNSVTIDMGVSYLPVTPGLSEYYGLGVDSGALVTEVAQDSIADKAGLKVGDVILAFNGTEVGEDVPLFGMMRECPPGSPVTLEVWRGDSYQKVELLHTSR